MCVFFLGGGGGSNAVLPPLDSAAWDVRLRNVY